MAEGSSGDLREETTRQQLSIGREEDSVKLFVGQVPKHMTEEQLLVLFKEIAIVDEVNIIRDKATKTSRGCCFLICPSREEADKAVSAYHNKKTLPGASSPLQVKYADGELERLEHKLFVGMLPKTVTDDELSDLFLTYGNIKDLQILRGSQQTSKGCAFLKYDTKEQALAALEALNGKHRMEGSNVPLVVKWADTEKERQARRAQKAQSQVSKMGRNDSIQQPGVYGASPFSFIPPYNGYGFQPHGNYSIYPVSVQNQAAAYNNNMFQQGGNNNNAIRGINPDSSSPNTGGPKTLSAMQLGSPYSPVGAVQYPLHFANNNSNGSNRPPPPLGNNHVGNHLLGNNLSVNANSNSTGLTGTSNSNSQIEGPPGANLFIYHIPQEYGDQDLANAFQGFGRVLSAKVFVDKATGVSKCFGFVSYDSTAAAQSAISMMNGYQLGGKKLKVQLKRENKQPKPF